MTAKKKDTTDEKPNTDPAPTETNDDGEEVCSVCGLKRSAPRASLMAYRTTVDGYVTWGTPDGSEYPGTGGFPPLETIRVEIGVPSTVLTDEQLGSIAGAAQDVVVGAYEWAGELPDGLYQVFLREVARTVAARGLPLGMVGTDSEYGVARLTTRDSEITRLGAMYRKRTFA